MTTNRRSLLAGLLGLPVVVPAAVGAAAPAVAASAAPIAIGMDFGTRDYYGLMVVGPGNRIEHYAVGVSAGWLSVEDIRRAGGYQS